MLRALLLAVLGVCLPLPSLAWSALGHRLVGDLAAEKLTPRAKAQVAELLAGEENPTLGGVAYWADALRDLDPPRFKATSAWHYVNAGTGGCSVDPARDCKDGNCVTGAIEAQRRLLADRSQPHDVRRDALKFLVHLVGDAHQPMHAGDRPDAGGNSFQVSLRTDIEPEAYARRSYVNGVMGTNLHSIWDYYILAEARLSERDYVDRLRRIRVPARITRERSPAAWSRESCTLIAVEHVYPAEHVMDRSYLDAFRPLAERRVVIAAARLATLLNDALR